MRISAPFGDVVLDASDRPVLLASAGIGCTPMIGMLGGLAADTSARRVVVVHGDRDGSRHAFRADLEQLVAQLRDRGVPAADIHYELFTPDMSPAGG